jgi:hypothetical protein
MSTDWDRLIRTEVANDRRKYAGKCPEIRVNARGGNAAKRVLFRHQMIAE